MAHRFGWASTSRKRRRPLLLAGRDHESCRLQITSRGWRLSVGTPSPHVIPGDRAHVAARAGVRWDPRRFHRPPRNVCVAWRCRGAWGTGRWRRSGSSWARSARRWFAMRGTSRPNWRRSRSCVGYTGRFSTGYAASPQWCRGLRRYDCAHRPTNCPTNVVRRYQCGHTCWRTPSTQSSRPQTPLWGAISGLGREQILGQEWPGEYDVHSNARQRSRVEVNWDISNRTGISFVSKESRYNVDHR